MCTFLCIDDFIFNVEEIVSIKFEKTYDGNEYAYFEMKSGSSHDVLVENEEKKKYIIRCLKNLAILG